ncbi:hypothetical protein JBE27_00255 [Streptomyces albiflaviniger]|nr:hypothetical protein [Streptomyces albiflaviniger]
MTVDHATALVVLLVIVSGLPRGRLACRLGLGPMRHQPADTRGTCPPTCTALNEGDR